MLKQYPQLQKIKNPSGHIDLIKVLGKGNFGYVYKGVFKRDNTVAAVKVVTLKQEELREIFLEVEILRMLSHPNIVRYKEMYLKSFDSKLDLWICMEFCGAGSMDSVYRDIPKALSEDHISAILFEAVSGLAYSHKMGLIHRDIKAGNLLVTESGEVKLGDFGVSAKLKLGQTRANSFIGTPYWMAPEVILCEHSSTNSYDNKCDIWSIGVTAIELNDKVPPLADLHPMRALALIPTSKLSVQNPKKCSSTFLDFIDICLTKDPKLRPSAEDLLNHPFLERMSSSKRNLVLKDLIRKVKSIRLSEKDPAMLMDSDEEFEGFDSVNTKLTSPTLSTVPVMPTVNGTVKANDTPYKTNNDRRRYQSAQFLTQKSTSQTLIRNDSATLEIYQECPIIHQEITCGDVVGGQYLILGSDKCLMAVDLALPIEHQQVVILINGVRFRKIQVLEDYNVMIALCGKNNHVRSYKLNSLKKLIRYALGHFMPSRDWRKSGNTASAADMNTINGLDSVYRAARGGLEHVDDKALVDKWSNDYHKILETKQTINFEIQRTEETIFLASYTQKDIVLFQWAKEPYLKFLKWKNFYLPPETPKFLKLLHDGLFVKEIFVCYAQEANIINVEQGQVIEFHIEDMPSDVQWSSFEQLPLKEVPRMKERVTVNRKILAAIRPTVSRSSDRSGSIQRHFLATSGERSFIVDLQGRRVPGSPEFKWSHPPSRIILVNPSNHICGISSQFVEVLSINTGEKYSGDDLSFPTTFLSQCPRTMDVFLVSLKAKKFSYILSLPLIDTLPAPNPPISSGSGALSIKTKPMKEQYSRSRTPSRRIPEIEGSSSSSSFSSSGHSRQRSPIAHSPNGQTERLSSSSPSSPTPLSRNSSSPHRHRQENPGKEPHSRGISVEKKVRPLSPQSPDSPVRHHSGRNSPSPHSPRLERPLHSFSNGRGEEAVPPVPPKLRKPLPDIRQYSDRPKPERPESPSGGAISLRQLRTRKDQTTPKPPPRMTRR